MAVGGMTVTAGREMLRRDSGRRRLSLVDGAP
jgi:hypothetical protein